MKKSNMAAMFGLDARIALAIFGSLSVIAGVALYSVLKEAASTQLLSSLSEISKAYEQYYLDVGKEMPAGPALIDVEEFIKSSKVGWKGPYLPFPDDGTVNNSRISHNLYEGVRVLMAESAGWTYNAGGITLCTFSGNRCMVFATISVDHSSYYIDLAKKLDKKIDGEDGPTTGNFRYFDVTSGSYSGKIEYCLYIMDRFAA